MVDRGWDENGLNFKWSDLDPTVVLSMALFIPGTGLCLDSIGYCIFLFTTYERYKTTQIKYLKAVLF